ncbi:MAG: glycosyl hydrolase family 65 protein [Pseudomonadota bacterium]
MRAEKINALLSRDETKISFHDDGAEVHLHDPTRLPMASGYLWNASMLARVNCRGYVHAQFMQPEPSSYSRGPVYEATTFLQAELAPYAHHPGRFVFLKDEASGQCISLPYEPMRRSVDRFRFVVAKDHVRWQFEHDELQIEWRLHLADDCVAECWTLRVTNQGRRQRRLSVYPVFSIGYMSWMNQSATFDPSLNAIVARSVPPYQKLEDCERIRAQKAWTFLCADRQPNSFETIQSAFEGEGGLFRPSALTATQLGNGEAAFETPIAALQFRETLSPGDNCRIRFLFGPAHDEEDIRSIQASQWEQPKQTRAATERPAQCITSPNTRFDQFVSHWLPRQIRYHGDLQRLTTDPQTRNFLQDALGQLYLRPAKTRDALLLTLSQQNADGGLPDGLLLNPQAELKYINQVPHTDHAVWLPMVLQAYIDETADSAFLEQSVEDGRGQSASVFARVDSAIDWLLANLDARDLSLIAQGDWCDPMNMVGHKGKGVSAWLTMATVVALDAWAKLCRLAGREPRHDALLRRADALRASVQNYFWQEDRFARGITDDGRVFGTSADAEGKVFLNAQSWALMAGIADDQQTSALLSVIDNELQTDFGPMMLAPAYTQFVDDIGRLTQKNPGYAENGSIYNHAAMFYAWALYDSGFHDRAFDVLCRCLPLGDEDDLIRRGQLPVFIPNYYRGAVHQFPRTAGRSSQLINTGAASWCYRIVVEKLFGLQGVKDGLQIAPQLPSAWQHASIRRSFRGSTIEVEYHRQGAELRVEHAGQPLKSNVLTGIEAGKTYQLTVYFPELGHA